MKHVWVIDDINYVIYEGGGGKTIEEDLNNIVELMSELAEDNKIK